MNTVNPEADLKRVIKIVAEQLGLDEAQVTPEKKFVADLGADSLDMVELIMALEDEFGCEIYDDEAEKIYSVQEAADLIARLRGTAGRVSD